MGEEAQKRAEDDELIKKLTSQLLKESDEHKKLVEEVAQNLAKGDELIKRLTSQLLEGSDKHKKLVEEVAKHLGTARIWLVIASLFLAIGSLVFMGIVYQMSLNTTNATNTWAAPIIISAFSLVVLVINVTFNMTVFKVKR